METGLKALIYALAGCRLLPFALTWIHLASARFDSERERVRKVLVPGTVLNLLVNGAAAWGVTALVFRTRKPAHRLLAILRMQGSWQDLVLLGITVLACAGIGILTGEILRRILLGKARTRVTRGRAGLSFLLVVICAALAAAGYGASLSGRDSLVLQEICRKTTVRIADPKRKEKLGPSGTEICYVKVANEGPLAYTANTLWLSDTEEEPQAFSFGGISIPAGGTVRLTMEYEHGLDIRANGGSRIYLSDSSGKMLDSAEIPALQENQAYVRNRKGKQKWEVRQLGNTVALPSEEEEPVPLPEFSHESGFYTEGFELALAAAEGTTVHYTLDCSTPTAESPVYDGPISVIDRSREPNRFRNILNVRRDYLNFASFGEEPAEKAFIVRAVAVDETGRLSDTVTKTYFINLDRYKERNVVSLVADPEDLFGGNGIYVTGAEYDAWTEEHREEILALPRAKASKQKDQDGDTLPSVWDSEPKGNFEKEGYEWERPADFTLWNQGELTLDQHTGIRIQGHGTRNSVLKRFSIYSRKEYSGSRYFSAILFNGQFSHSLMTREGTLNALTQTLAAGRDVLTQPYMTVEVFLNGEFWYTRFLYEKASERLISTMFGVNEEHVVIVKNGSIPQTAKEGENPFDSIYDYLEVFDLSDDERYEEFNRILDVQSYIDATCFQVYLANMDYKELWNNYYWHTDNTEEGAYGDTRWRLGLYDMDLRWKEVSESADVENYWEIDPFTMYGTWQKSSKAITKWLIFSSLRKSPIFCRQFVTTFMDLVNTVFRPEYVLPILEGLGETGKTTLDFFRYRPEYAAAFMARQFELAGTQETVTLEVSDPAGGTVKLNTITPDLSGGTWSGTYYTDYPVEAEAEPSEDYVFAGWEVNGEAAGTGRYKEFSFGEGGVTIRAVFVPRGEEQGQ